MLQQHHRFPFGPFGSQFDVLRSPIQRLVLVYSYLGMSCAEGVVRIDSKEAADDGRALKLGLLVHNIGANQWNARA